MPTHAYGPPTNALRRANKPLNDKERLRFTVKTDSSASRQKKHLDPPIAELVDEAEQALATNPSPNNPRIKKYHGLEDTFIYRLHPKWRLLFHLDVRTRVVTILDIDNRGRVYERFQRSKRS